EPSAQRHGLGDERDYGQLRHLGDVRTNRPDGASGSWRRGEWKWLGTVGAVFGRVPVASPRPSGTPLHHRWRGACTKSRRYLAVKPHPLSPQTPLHLGWRVPTRGWVPEGRGEARTLIPPRDRSGPGRRRG